MSGRVNDTCLGICNHVRLRAVIERHLRTVAVKNRHGRIRFLPHLFQLIFHRAVLIHPHYLESLGHIQITGAVRRLIDLHPRRDVDYLQILCGIAVIRKHRAQKGKQHQNHNHYQAADGRGLMPEAKPHVSGKGSVFTPYLFPVLVGGAEHFPFIFHTSSRPYSYLILGSMRQ